MGDKYGRDNNRITCPCGKWGYTTKTGAKKAGRVHHPGDHLATYRCDQSDYWHIGHLPGVVRGGQLPRTILRRKSDGQQ